MRGLLRELVAVLFGLTTLLAAFPVVVTAQATTTITQEQLVGTWRLDLAKSRYSPGPPPRGEIRLYERDPTGIKGRIDRQYADGRREVIDYRADADHESPVSGTKAYDAVRFRRVDEHTIESVLSHAGRVYGTARRVISPDGQTMTITFRREEPGDMVNNYAVYFKERK